MLSQTKGTKELSENKLLIFKNFIYLALTKGVDFIIPMLLLPFLVSKLGISSFGSLSFALAIGIYFNSLMQYGYNISAVRSIARSRDDYYLLSKSFSALLVSSLLICLFFSICYLFLFSFDFIRQEFSLYASVLAFVFMQSIFPAWFFQGLEKMHHIAITGGVSKIVCLFCILGLVKGPEDAFLVPLFQGAGWAMANIGAFYIISKNKLAGFKKPQIYDILLTYRSGWSAFVTQISPLLYTNSTTLILGIFHSPAIVGLYKASVRIIEIFNGFAFLLINAGIPHLSRDIRLHTWFKRIVVGLGVFWGVSVYFCSDWFVPLLFKDNGLQMLPLVKLASFMIPVIHIRFAFGPAFLMLQGEEDAYQKIVVLSSVAGFVCGWVFIPQWGIMAAIFVLLCTSSAMSLLTYVKAQRILLENRRKERIL